MNLGEVAQKLSDSFFSNRDIEIEPFRGKDGFVSVSFASKATALQTVRDINEVSLDEFGNIAFLNSGSTGDITKIYIDLSEDVDARAEMFANDRSLWKYRADNAADLLSFELEVANIKAPETFWEDFEVTGFGHFSEANRFTSAVNKVATEASMGSPARNTPDGVVLESLSFRDHPKLVEALIAGKEEIQEAVRSTGFVSRYTSESEQPSTGLGTQL